MRKNRWLLRAAALLFSSVVVCATVSAAAEAGSSGDPLVTLSYLNETFLPSVLSKLDEKIAARNTQLMAQIGQNPGGSGGAAASVFGVVTLTQGQTLTGDIGCEVMLRVGSAACVAASAPGLVDETAGTTLAGGKALTQNHLYMMTVEDRGVRASAATVKLLVRGAYTIA